MREGEYVGKACWNSGSSMVLIQFLDGSGTKGFMKTKSFVGVLHRMSLHPHISIPIPFKALALFSLSMIILLLFAIAYGKALACVGIPLNGNFGAVSFSVASLHVDL